MYSRDVWEYNVCVPNLPFIFLSNFITQMIDKPYLSSYAKWCTTLFAHIFKWEGKKEINWVSVWVSELMRTLQLFLRVHWTRITKISVLYTSKIFAHTSPLFLNFLSLCAHYVFHVWSKLLFFVMCVHFRRKNVMCAQTQTRKNPHIYQIVQFIHGLTSMCTKFIPKRCNFLKFFLSFFS